MYTWNGWIKMIKLFYAERSEAAAAGSDIYSRVYIIMKGALYLILNMLRGKQMKYKIFREFRDLLNQEQDIKLNTKIQYYKFAKKVLDNIDFTDVSQITSQRIEQEMNKLKTKNDVSAAKRGLEYFAHYFPALSLPENIATISSCKTNEAKREWQPLELDKVKRKINSLADPKLKLSYRLMLATGMRVSEVEQIRKRDISIDEDEITLHIEDTKKNCPATITCKNPYLIKRLPEYLSQFEDDEKAFYSIRKMQKEAELHDFECHDLRRAYSQTEYNNRVEDVGAKVAIEEVQQLMRHDSKTTTKGYLRREIIKK